MKDYVNPCIRNNNPEYVILYVGTNKLNSELTLNQSTMSAKTFKPTVELSVYPVEYLVMTILIIKPRMQIKNFPKFVRRKNYFLLIIATLTRKHLNRSKLHLNCNGYGKMSKNFVSFIRNNYAWLPVTSKKVYRHFDDSPTLAEVKNELVPSYYA